MVRLERLSEDLKKEVIKRLVSGSEGLLSVGKEGEVSGISRTLELGLQEIQTSKPHFNIIIR